MLKELTPIKMRCGLGACPAIFQDEQGNFVLIGEQVPDLVDASRVGKGETVIKVPRELLASLFIHNS
jgi:hypothetical protein